MKAGKDTTSLATYEKGAICKSWNQTLRVALVYPNTYAVGMANLGFQTVYSLFNAPHDVVCERVFLPSAADARRSRLVSLETRRRIFDFDLVAFSISFEEDYPHILTILELADIPLLASEREAMHPLVLAGGVACFLNPEPVADFIDVFLLGEAEVLAPACVDVCRRTPSRQSRLEMLARQVQGAYVPQFYHSEATLEAPAPPVVPRYADIPPAIECVYDAGFENREAPASLVSTRAAFGPVYLIETGRGCSRGCRFCSAGFIYRPPRFKTLAVLRASLTRAARLSQHVGLVGAAIADVPDIAAVCQQARQQRLRLSFSSLRADALNPELLKAITGCCTWGRVKTATIAPDAGSERLRRVINKGLDEQTLMQAVDHLVAAGIPNLKLYFMIGLPTESMADIQALVDLCRLFKQQFLAASRPRGRLGTITVSISPFVPKPATPFQWAAMNDLPELNRKIALIRKSLHKEPNLRLHLDTPLAAARQALLARGDRSLGAWLLDQHHNPRARSKLSAAEASLMARYVHRQRPLNEPLAWNIVAHRVKSAWLQREYERSQQATPTAACIGGKCGICGACTRTDGTFTGI